MLLYCNGNLCAEHEARRRDGQQPNLGGHVLGQLRGPSGYAISAFDRHNAEVEAVDVPADRLLVYEVKEGWGPLCEFLGVEVPDEPFPHLNDTADFKKMVRQSYREVRWQVFSSEQLVVLALIYGTRRART